MSAQGLWPCEKRSGVSIDASRSRRGGHARSFFEFGGSFGLEVLLKRTAAVLGGSATADGRMSATTMPSLPPSAVGRAAVLDGALWQALVQ